ncbi:MAG: 1,4-alpha-glucan branching protein GlgB [Candidatus Riflebacteria bacterium]|nr:1,4-alpha-glucan branching protein GlgB [Candidatus Riflebacteria bacterium]
MKILKKYVSDEAIQQIIKTNHHDPFQILGSHQIEVNGKKAVAVRAFLPDAICVHVVDAIHGTRYPMEKLHDAGFFEAIITERSEVFSYRLSTEYPSGATAEFNDSYSFPPTLGEMDLYLFNQGNHQSIYEKLGAHSRIMKYYDTAIAGIGFAVWAPNARRVSVIGDFNGWDGRRHVMRSLGSSGVWEIFIPGLPTGQNYKFEVKFQDGTLAEKSDPYAFYAEVRPKTASKIYDIAGYHWGDSEWMNVRPTRNWRKEPISIYECHLASWMRIPEEGNRSLTYREIAPRLVAYMQRMHYTHLELMPITEHPLDISWGYQVTGYFAPTSRFGSPKDFMYFVDVMHQNGIAIILDWVPAHFPKDWHGLAQFDGSALYEHADPRKGEHKDWSTLIFNYGRNEVKNFLISNALFWLDKYHLDGFRVDAVASMLYLDYSRKDGEWVPNDFGGRENLEAIEFIKYFNSICYQKFPGIINIAEESTAFPGVSKPCDMNGLGFGFKWNMGWMHDTLTYFQKDPIHRRYHHNLLTFPLIYAFNENFISVLSHDEVVHGKGSLINKMPGDAWQKFANTRLLLSFMWTMPGKKLLFMGCDLGQWNEWNCNQSLDWHLLDFPSHSGLNHLIADLNKLYRAEPCLHQLDLEGAGFEWIDFADAETGIVSWIRKGDDPEQTMIFIANFTPIPREGYRVGIPQEGFYRELINTDSEYYYGTNLGNAGGVRTQNFPWQGRANSLQVNVPPLALVGLKIE